MQTYARPELVFTRGEGARLYDAHGKEYLDFAAGIAVNALGARLYIYTSVEMPAMLNFKKLCPCSIPIALHLSVENHPDNTKY